MGAMIGIIVVFLLFEVFTVATNMVLTARQINGNEADVLRVLGQEVWSGPGGKVIVLAVILSTVATLETTLIQVTRTMFAMGRDNTLPRFSDHAPKATDAISCDLGCHHHLPGALPRLAVLRVDRIDPVRRDRRDWSADLYLLLPRRPCGGGALSQATDKSPTNFIFMGLWPLIGAVFMAYLFCESIPQSNAATLWVGLGAMALGLIPMFYYWAKATLLRNARQRRSPRRCSRSSSKFLSRPDLLVQDGTVRIVSLVPSVTETLTAWNRVPIACTRFCERPDLEHVGGTKNPDIARIEALRPDLIVMDAEENRREDYDALIDRGLTVCVLHIRSLRDVSPSKLEELALTVGVTWRRLELTSRCQCVFERSFPYGGIRGWPSVRLPTEASLLQQVGVENVYEGDGVTESTRRGWSTLPGRRDCPKRAYPFSVLSCELESVAPTYFVDGKDLFWWGHRTARALARLAIAIKEISAART